MEFVSNLQAKLSLKYKGPISEFLGVKFFQDGNLLSLSQEHYINELFDQYSPIEKGPSRTPLIPKFKLSFLRSDWLQMGVKHGVTCSRIY